VVALTTRGGVREYEVFETLIVEPMDVWVLEPSDTATLTLVTCFPFYFVGSAPQRFIVRAAILASG
jgi:LPXTG-site transpeptidase (sortase) family protein